MARAIIRFSLDDDYGSQIRNAAYQLLTDAGFSKIGTSSYEVDADHLTADEILTTLTQLSTLLCGMPGGRALDHLWVYVDNPEPE